jgi:hypothetical protein
MRFSEGLPANHPKPVLASVSLHRHTIRKVAEKQANTARMAGTYFSPLSAPRSRSRLSRRATLIAGMSGAV